MLQWDKKKKEREERRPRQWEKRNNNRRERKMEKAKQLMKGTYKWKEKYKKTKKT